MIPEALEQMKEVEVSRISDIRCSHIVYGNLIDLTWFVCVQELETTLHGDRSLNIAKTYKVIGTLYMINTPPEPQAAKEYLLRAQSIFE